MPLAIQTGAICHPQIAPQPQDPAASETSLMSGLALRSSRGCNFVVTHLEREVMGLEFIAPMCQGRVGCQGN